MHILINRGLHKQLSSHSLVLTSYFAYLIVSEFSAFQAPHAEILMLTFLLRANMYTIGADPDQALCLIRANIVHDYKCTYGPRDTNLTNLIYFYADCYSSCDFASIMPVYCDSSREHYVLNRDFNKARSPSNT